MPTERSTRFWLAMEERMSSSSSFSAEVWIQNLFDAWARKDFKAIGVIFEHCETYMEDPFYPVLHSIGDIMPLWTEVEAQEKIELDYIVLSESAAGVTYRWMAKFFVEDKFFDLDGIYFVTFDEGGECKKFCQWTVERE